MNYDVFARINPGDEVIRIGSVEAATDRLAKSYARTTYDEEDWDYLAVVRREDVLEVPTAGALPDAARGEP